VSDWQLQFIWWLKTIVNYQLQLYTTIHYYSVLYNHRIISIENLAFYIEIFKHTIESSFSLGIGICFSFCQWCSVAKKTNHDLFEYLIRRSIIAWVGKAVVIAGSQMCLLNRKKNDQIAQRVERSRRYGVRHENFGKRRGDDGRFIPIQSGHHHGWR